MIGSQSCHIPTSKGTDVKKPMARMSVLFFVTFTFLR